MTIGIENKRTLKPGKFRLIAYGEPTSPGPLCLVDSSFLHYDIRVGQRQPEHS